MSRRMTEMDYSVLDTLTRRVRIADEAQLEAAHGIGVPPRLAWLRKRRFLQQGIVAVRMPAVEVPVCCWSPGDPAPVAGRLAWRLQKRWNGLAQERTSVWWATSRSAELMGGVGGRLRQPLQVAHDLGVTAIYCRYVGDGRATNWIGEDLYRREFRPRRGEKVADAVLLDGDEEIVRIIEFGGAYPASRVRAFHRYWSRRKIPYELW